MYFGQCLSLVVWLEFTSTCNSPGLFVAASIIYKYSQYIHMSHIMRKPVYAICEQQRRRSTCTFAQSDQRLCWHIPLIAIVNLLLVERPASHHHFQTFRLRGCLLFKLLHIRKGKLSFYGFKTFLYRYDPKYLDRQVWANSVDKHQTAPHGKSD